MSYLSCYDAGSHEIVYVHHFEGISNRWTTVKMMCGGTSDAKPADAEIQAIINEVIWNKIYYSCVLKIYGVKN